MQLLSQGQYLAEQDFKANPDSELRMTRYIASMTPERPDAQVLELWEYLTREGLVANLPSLDTAIEVRNKGWMTYPQATYLIRKMSEMSEFSQKQIQTHLRVLGVNQVRKIDGKTTRIYLLSESLEGDRSSNQEGRENDENFEFPH